MGLSLTAYSNDTERAWYKTEGLDADGSDSPESFSRTSWASVIAAINQDNVLAGQTPEQLQAILNGADTPEGSIQLRNNAREYFARGVQLVFDMPLQSQGILHELQAGLRYHQDQEDRLQRNDNYRQLNGQLLLDTLGMQGNAGNQVQDATAWAAYVYDRIVWDDWTLTPGVRYENIDLSRTRWNSSSADPASRDPENFRDYRENRFDIWLPGLGLLYAPTSATRIVAGVHKGFATPSNAPGVDPEESVNYELGFRYDAERLSLEAMLFFNDYDNLVGVCTNASGSDCDPGDAFNGNGVHVPGLELTLSTWFEPGSYWQIPVQVAYTWMNAEFQTAFDSEFFGEVHAGDPVPYVPDSQLWATVGLEGGKWSLYLSGSHAASVCTEVGCNAFERTGSATIYDASVHFRAGRNWELYGLAQNLTDQVYIAARDPYGARPNKPRTFMAGIKLEF
jgi:Fe(3+) dicitrate transport protein